MFLDILSFESSSFRYNFPVILILIAIFSFSKSLATEVNTSKCEQTKDAIQIQQGIFVRPGHDGVIFEDKDIANIGFIIGDDSIAVIDSGGSIHEGEQLLCQIRKVSHLPIRYLINTHVHPDHTMGNSAFNDAEITFIGHENLTHAIAVLGKTYLRRYNDNTGENITDESILHPQVKVAQELEINLGNRPLLLIAAPVAHTNNDLLVHDIKTSTLWLSDLLFHQHIPVIGKSGSVNGWLSFIQKLNVGDYKSIIPGHGSLEMDWHLAIQNQVRYLKLLQAEIRSNINKDADLAAAMETIGLTESSNWNMFSTYHKRNISYIFSELEWE